MEPLFREQLARIVTDLLSRMGFSADVKVSETALPDDRVNYHADIVLADGQQLLIGQHGANISALLQVVRLLVRKEQPANGSITLDVNHYLHEKKVYLEKEAMEAAKEVEATGLPVTLRPMPAYERKLIHTLFATHPTILTESVGTGENRKVLLKRRGEAPATETSVTESTLF